MKSLANASLKSLVLLLALAGWIASVGCAGGGEDVAGGDGQNVEEGVDPGNGEENAGQAEDEEEVAIEDGPVCGDGILDPAEQCDDGDDVSGDGCSAICELELLEVLGEVEIDIVSDSLVSNEAPVSDVCLGGIEAEVEGSLIFGEGDCALQQFNNFMSYELDAEIGPGGSVDGEIAVVFNGKEEIFEVEGELQDGRIKLVFDGVTLPIQSVRLVWDGLILIDLD